MALPTILSVTESGNNTASTSWAVNFPASSTGDLIVVCLSWDDSTTVTSITTPAGPNSETFTKVPATPVADNADASRGQVFYTVATGTWSAGTRTFTPSAS